MQKNINLFDHQLTSPEFLDNPYPVYHQLRAEAPVYWSEAWHCWVLTRYEDVKTTFRDPENFLNGGRFTSLLEQLPPEVRAEVEPLENHFLYGVINSDPPAHTRLRKLIHLAFTPRVLAQMRDDIQAIVDEQLDRVQDRGQMDVVRELAYPLPVIVIAKMLGVPPEERDQFKQWSDDIIAFQASGRTTPETIRLSQRALLDMRAYLRQIFARRRQNPQDDLITALIKAEEEGDKLSEEEILSTCVTLLVAGHETTTNLIGNGIFTLLQHPAQLQELKNDPSLIQPAVEEVLRYESPLQRNRRVVARDLEFEGQAMQKGQLVLQILGAANRDPEQFPDPDRFDLHRQPNKHIAFGFGIHFCLGAPLARLEAPIAINTLLRRMPTLQLASETVEWQREHSVIRGLKSLPVTF